MGNDGTITIDTKINTKSFEAQIAELEDDLEVLVEEYEAVKNMQPFEGQAQELKKMAREVEKTKNRIIDLKEKEELASRVDFSQVGYSLEKIGTKLGRFALRLIGVGGIYGVLSRATTTYLQANEETAQKMNSIWTALANLIGPIIEKIADWILQLVGYLNVFLKAVSGGKIDLTKNMNKNTNAIKGTTNAMKSLNAQMATFDEATKLQDTTSTTGSGGIAGVDDAINQLSNISLNPEWEQKLKNFGEKIADFLKNPINAIKEAINEYHETIEKFDEEEKRLKVFRKTTDKSKQAINKLRESVKKSNLTTEETATITQNLNSKIADNVALISGSKNAIDGANRALDTMGWLFVTNTNETKSLNGSIYQNEKAIRRQSDEMRENILAQKELRTSGKLSEDQVEAYKQQLILARNELTNMGGAYGVLGNRVKANLVLIQSEIDKINNRTSAETIAIDTMDKWNNMVMKDKSATVTISQNIVSSVSDFAGMSKNLAQSIILAMKASIEGLNIADSVKSSLKKAFGLARGGIINLPGPGVPLTNGVVGGERGAEGVIPLTDSQQMEILGEAIGKYITINASITNTMNGRVISRELQKINGENDFAGNR